MEEKPLAIAQRLLRTFLAAAITSIPVFTTQNITDKPWLYATLLSAAVAGVNAVVIGAQKAIPFIPDPK